jgi:hypothetical protein
MSSTTDFQQIADASGNVITSIIQRVSDGAFIPADPENRDYQAYLVWVAAGNTAAPPAS